MIKKSKKYIAMPVAVVALMGSVGLTAFISSATAANADTTSTNQTSLTTNAPHTSHAGMHKEFEYSGISGTVSAINGTTLSVLGRDNKTYTVDASAAMYKKLPTLTDAEIAAKKVAMLAEREVAIKNGTKPTPPAPPVLPTIAFSDIKIGDTVMVRGTKTNLSVVATEIVDGKMPAGFGGMHKGYGGFTGMKHKTAAGTVNNTEVQGR